MIKINYQELRERYSEKTAPKCHICGAEMTVQRISGSHITYGCTGATYDDKGCHYAEGRSIADDHYGQSRVTVVDVSDPDVLALLDELDKEKGYASAFEAEKWHYHVLAESEGERADRAEKALEAAQKRIAELEGERAARHKTDGNSPVIPDCWIKCSDRTPSSGEKVLAYRPDAPESNDPLIKIATYVGKSAYGHGFDCYCKPTHWMPLPAAPQQEVR